MLIFTTFFLLNCNHTNENTTVDNKTTKDSCCIKKTIESSTKSSTKSEITCPECGYKKMEIMPTDVCLIKYTCDSCTSVSYSKDGDCCVFCSYGTHKCPSKQVE
jgi:hypothetical protein